MDVDPEESELSDVQIVTLRKDGYAPDGVRKPQYCPDCASERILHRYDNSADPGFHQWFVVGCHDCGQENRITPQA